MLDAMHGAGAVSAQRADVLLACVLLRQLCDGGALPLPSGAGAGAAGFGSTVVER